MNRPTGRDQGSAGVEAAIAVTSLIMVGFFIVGALRVTNTAGDVDAAARSATRAAAAEYDDASAFQTAQAVVASELADRGVACEQLNVRVGGTLAAGGVITVDVTCVVSLADVVLAGFPGSKTVSGRGVEQVDVVRGGR